MTKSAIGLATEPMYRGVFILLSMVSVSGCTHSYLYDAGRDQQGQAAAKAASGVKLADTVDAVEKRFQGLSDLEQNAASNRFGLIRELEIRELAFSKKPIGEVWIRRIEARQIDLYGGADWRVVDQAGRRLKNEQKTIDLRHDDFLDASGRNAPDCDVVVKNDNIPDSLRKTIATANLPSADANYIQLRINCVAYLAAQKAYRDALNITKTNAASGLYAQASAQLEGDQQKKGDIKSKRESAEAALADAVAAYENAAKKVTAPDEKNTYEFRLSEASKKLTQDLESIETTQGKIGREVVAKKQLDQLESILKAVAGGEVDTSKWSDGVRSAVGIVGTLPSLADETRKNLLEAGRPRLLPYVLAREHQRLIVEEAAKVNAILDQRIAASTQIVDAYQKEIEALTRVREHLPNNWYSKSLLELSKDLKGEDRRVLYEFLGTYFDDVPRFQRDQQLWEYRRLSTFYDEVIEHSKYAAQMWQNLVEGVANSLQGYHASGVKPAELAEFLKAFGLIYIGVGANK